MSRRTDSDTSYVYCSLLVWLMQRHKNNKIYNTSQNTEIEMKHDKATYLSLMKSSNLSKSGKEMIKNLKNSELQAKFNAIAERCGTSSKRALLAAREKGASSWLNTLPLQQF